MSTIAAADRLSHRVIGACIRVHDALGPGLLETVYETCLELELRKGGSRTTRQVPIGLRYEELPAAFKADLIVEGQLIVEVKAVGS